MTEDQPESSDATPEPERRADGLFSGSVLRGLERLRKRLLDLTRKNRLLNFRHSKRSSLRVIDELPDQLCDRLLAGNTLTFRAIPSVDQLDETAQRALGEAPSAEDVARSMGLSASYEMPSRDTRGDDPADKHADRYIQTLLFPEDLEVTLRSITGAAKTTIEESGTNMLHLALGFLEWTESDSSERTHLAPLFLVPVTVERGRVDSATGTYVYKISHSGEDITTNLSLREKLRHDFGLEMPELEEEELPEAYWERFQILLTNKPRWQIRRYVTLSLFHFGRLLLYLDLDPKRWPDEAQLASHPLVKSFFEGNPEDPGSATTEYDLDRDSDKARDAPIILDADSSQHSALIDALDGKNLVVEGPPGTGKSQTITNLIAAALDKGKTVLFVSEKLAALEVVRRRLNEASLGHFCLELHSHKTQKRQLLDDVAQRIHMQDFLSPPRRFGTQLKKLESARDQLAKHAALMGEEFEGLSMSVHEVLSAATRYRLRLGENAYQVEESLPVVPEGIDGAQLEGDERALEVYVRAFRDVSSDDDLPENHAWAMVRRPDIPVFDVPKIGRLLDSWMESSKALKNALERLHELVGDGVQLTADEAVHLAEVSGRLPTAPGSMLWECLPALCSSTSRKQLKRFADQLAEDRTRFAELAQRLADPEQVTLEQARSLAGDTSWLAETVDGSLPLKELPTLNNALGEAVGFLEEADAFVSRLSSLLGVPLTSTSEGLKDAVSVVGLANSAPLPLLGFRSELFDSEGFEETVTTAEDRAEVLRKERLDLSIDLDVQAAPASEELRGAVRLLRGSGLFSWLSRDWRTANGLYKSLALHGERRPPSRKADDLTRLAEFLDGAQSFDADELLVAKLGPLFRGLRTEFKELKRVHAWYVEVRTEFPRHTGSRAAVGAGLLNCSEDVFVKVRALVSDPYIESAKALSERLELLGAAGIVVEPSSTLVGSRDQLEKHREQLSAAFQPLSQLALAPTLTPTEAHSIVLKLQTAHEERHRLSEDSTVPQILGSAFKGCGTDELAVRETLGFVGDVANLGLSAPVFRWVLAADPEKRLDKLRTRLSDIVRDLSAYETAVSDFTDNTDFDAEFWHRGQEPPIELSWVLERGEEALGDVSALGKWLEYLHSARRAKHLRPLWRLVEAGALPSESLEDAYRLCVFGSVARHLLEIHPALKEFRGVEYDVLRARFAELDEDVMALQRERIAHRAARLGPWGNSVGPVRSLTERALLEHEINKKKRHIPIRQLVRRSGGALQEMKPCFMMGPLSVAQYLEPGALSFDLLVMDEASQIRPEDAIGAVARAKQVVIVGDPKQLPPTSFFERMFGDEAEDDDQGAAEDNESILDAAASLFRPMRRLRWHYRSQHESLIAFSNLHFYQRDLVVFPSALSQDERLGVKYVKVEGAVYGKSVNPLEARVVAEAVIEHMKSHPGQSLGVAAMNRHQADLIEAEVDRLMKTEPAAYDYFETRKEGSEPFFVKNLENVQGDERNVIFISVTYGPNDAGHVVRRFGPINLPHGWRRLNVLITRAKTRLVVFTSMHSSQIGVDPGMPEGAKKLHDYLAYAETGVLHQPEFSGKEPQSDFEIAVAEALRNRGYECVAQLGVAGFFLDLAVKHPDKPGSYLLGVECDGATYHSAKSVRDRDRLRQSILERLHWRIHRIWSTDWFHSPERELEKLQARLEELRHKRIRPPGVEKQDDRIEAVGQLKNPEQLEHGEARHEPEQPGLDLGRTEDHPESTSRIPQAPVRERRPQRASTSLTLEEARERLILLRENEVIKAFPNAARSGGILRKHMIDVLLRARPSDADEYRARIPGHLQRQTDADQLRDFGDQVFAILSRVAD